VLWPSNLKTHVQWNSSSQFPFSDRLNSINFSLLTVLFFSTVKLNSFNYLSVFGKNLKSLRAGNIIKPSQSLNLGNLLHQKQSSFELVEEIQLKFLTITEHPENVLTVSCWSQTQYTKLNQAI
jgi:hypothetical protein